MLWCITFSGMGDIQHDIAQYVQAPDIRAALDTFDQHIAEVWGKGRTLVKSCALVTTGRVVGNADVPVIGPDDPHLVSAFDPPFRLVVPKIAGGSTRPASPCNSAHAQAGRAASLTRALTRPKYAPHSSA